MIYRRDGKHRIARKLMENVPANHFLPYPYQLDLLHTAYERNTIICLSNELTKNFIVLSLIREMGFDRRGKRVIYFTSDKNVAATSRCLTRHTGYSVGCFQYAKPYTEWQLPHWMAEFMKYDIIVISPWLIWSLCSGASGKEVQHFVFNNFYLLVLNECHHVLSSSHPYFQLLGPHYLRFFTTDGSNSDDAEVSGSAHRDLRVICFTSALLPRDLTDSFLAETRLIELERRTNCCLETASQLLTLLSLGARPQEYVRMVPNTYAEPCIVHNFVAQILAETREFLLDIRLDATDTITMDSAPDSRGRMICVLDYCRRAMVQCEEILFELGVWCAALIARVFVKHLIGLSVRRARLLQQRSPETTGDHREDPLARILIFTITQLCLIVRLCQSEFDTCLTLNTFQTMISPKVLALVEQLKEYKPSMNFRIEIAELPVSSGQPRVSRKSRRNRNRRQRASSLNDSISMSSSSFLPDELSESSDTSVDTMSSVSDEEDNTQRGSRSRKSSVSHGAGTNRRKSKNKTNCSQLSSVKARDLKFFPSTELLSNGIRPELDHCQLVYRAVLDSDDPNHKSQPPRLYGLVLVRCQFTAYALSRLIDELCIWDVDLFFVKPGHLFSCHGPAPRDTTRSAQSNDYALHQAVLKTGDDTSTVHTSTQATLPATQEETIAKFRHGAINLLVATQPAISAAAGGAELPRCNLIVTLHPPNSLAEYLSSKARSRLVDQGTRVTYLVDKAGSLNSANGEYPALTDSVRDGTNSTATIQSETAQILGRFQKLEKLLVQRCRGYALLSDEHDVDPTVADRALPQLMPRGPHGPKLPLSKSINIINQYCARLPSDYITNLTPRWRLRLIPQPECWYPPLQGPGASCGSPAEIEFAHSHGLHQCLLRLPINSSVKEEIHGEPMACKKLAKLSAALNAVSLLYAAGELDSRWEPSGKGAPSAGPNVSRPAARSMPSNPSLVSLDTSEWEPDICDLATTCNPALHDDLNALDGLASRRRQYYYRKVADQMQNCLPRTGDSPPNYLYFIEMRLTSAVPDDQNTRGRPCFRPEDEPIGFGLLTSKPLIHIPAFPIFSRSGKETVRLIELWSPLAPSGPYTSNHSLPIRAPAITENQLNQLVEFHRILFQAVLRLDREAVIEFNMNKSYTQVLVVPVRKDKLSLEWEFISLVLSSYTAEGVCRLPPRRDVSKIPENQTAPSKNRGISRVTNRTRNHPHGAHSSLSFNQPGVFEFREEDFINAVVMPTYRNLDQPQHYYVADIRYDLSPLSPFPSSAYPDFASYYANKYEATLTTTDQPLLDVDFTVLRLNLLVPRYINSRGYCLPCTTDARKRDKRENLTHKQILIPELCFRHPFPASVWRKAVCLPSVLYRLHSLLLAEELRRRIAYETGLGRARLPKQCKTNGRDSQEDQALFEPLRLVFPLQIQQPVTGDECGPRRSEANLDIGSGRRGCREHTPAPKDSNSLASGNLDKSNSIEDADVTIDKKLPPSEAQTQHDTPAEPVFVKLRALPATAAITSGGLSTVDGSVNLESLLEETKVIELDDVPSNGLADSDSDEFVVVENRTNIDLEYHGTDSDVESVDSFEGNVHFFPSEDDYEVDDQAPESSTSSPETASCLEDEHSGSKPIPRCYRPGPANVLQALTLSCSNDFINLERMETIGDSFLKFAVTVHLFLTHPHAHEGKLSHLRSRLVCNSNLYRLGRLKNLQDRIIATKFGPYENWVPPGYVVRHDRRLPTGVKSDDPHQESKQTVDLNIWSTDTLMDDEVLLGTKVWDEDKVTPIDNLSVSVWDPTSPEVVQTQQRIDHCLVTIQQAIPDKSVADCVEALVGCYLTTRGERSALRLLRWFDIDCLPAPGSYIRPHGAPWSPPPPSFPPNDPRWAQLNEARLVWRLNELESQLRYTFKDPALLLQAFTHPSYHQLRNTPSSETDSDQSVTTFLTDTECYQRLEFLGDAVLDYVITRFLYEDSQQHSPGVLTDLRSALVNNNIFAALAVRIGLHEFLRASSPQLLHMIDAFVCYQKDVAKDDLDFITSEDIEIRESEPPDLLEEEPATALTGTYVDPAPIDINAPSKGAHTLEQPTQPEDDDEDEEEDRNETADASLLVTAKDRESQWQKANAKQLLGHFIDDAGDVVDKPFNDESTASHPKLAQPIKEQSHPSVGDSRRISDDIEIPKALGDIFESLAGAIFLDSGLSLDTVWTVFYPIMKERIERYTACIPKSPVRHLLELEPEGTRFERPRRTADGRISVCAHVLGKGRFYGIGRNYRLAKSLAAKRALRILKKLQAEHPSSASKPA